MRILTCTHLEHRPAAIGGDPAELSVRIDRDRVADELEEREIGRAVGIGSASCEIETFLAR
jgi:hypothetical protein